MDKMKHFPALQWALPVIGILALLFTLVYGGAGIGVLLLACGIIFLFEYLFHFKENKIFGPYSWMIFAPLLLIKYSSITDFRIRVLCFIFFVYIFNTAFTKNVRKINFSLLKSKPLIVWLTAFAVFSLASAAVYLQGVHLSGDEPHYIMITQSLLEDGDFDLKNNIEEKTYFKYLPVEIRFHGVKYKGKHRSFHLPGVSFLLIPFYWLFKLLGGLMPAALYFRLAASFINAFFALCLFYLLKMKFPGRDITGFWLLFLFIFPLVFHSIHLYPELPAATLMMAAYLFTFSEKKNYLLAGFFLSLIPWFHIKYIPALLVLAPAIFYNLLMPPAARGSFAQRCQVQVPGTGGTNGVSILQSSLRIKAPRAARPLDPTKLLFRGLFAFVRGSFTKEKIKQLCYFFIFPVTGFILLVLYSKILYGTYSPANIFPKESYWNVPWLLRLKVFLAYFLDQRDGLLFYSPLFFLFFFSFKRKAVETSQMTGKYLLPGIAFSYVFFHAFTTVRGAYAPAGRPLIFVSWIFIIFIGHFYFNTLKENRFSFKLLAGLSFFILAWLFYYPLFVYQPVFSHTIEGASGFNLFFGGDFVSLWRFFPSFLTSPETGHLANYLWIGLLVLLLVYHGISHQGTKAPRRMLEKKPWCSLVSWCLGGEKIFHRLRGHRLFVFLLFLLFAFLYCFYPHVHLINKNKYTGKTISFYNNSRNFRYVPERKGFRIKGGRSYDIFIDGKMTRKDNITFLFFHRDVNRVTVRNGKELLFRSGGEREDPFSFRLSSLKPLRVKNKLVYHLGIETRGTGKNSFLWLEIH